jgi:aspartate racemase
MRTAGIVGGIAPESTIEYYREMIAAYRDRQRNGSYPPIVINSIDMQKMLALISANELSAVTDYLTGEVEKLAKAGADCGMLASNTPHIVFDEIHRRSPIPLVSIVEAACEAAKEMGLKKLGLFGTRFTMQGRFYPDVFSKAGIAVVTPREDEQAYVHDKYMNELARAIFLPETRAGLLAIVDRMRERDAIQGLILGGTELPLILRDATHNGVPLLNTSKIHVRAMVARLGW